MSVLRLWTMNWSIRNYCITEYRYLLLNIKLIHLRNRRNGPLPSLKHHLGMIGLLIWSSSSKLFLYPISWPIIATDLSLRSLFRGFWWYWNITFFPGLGVILVRHGHLHIWAWKVNMLRWVYYRVCFKSCIAWECEVLLTIDLHLKC